MTVDSLLRWNSYIYKYYILIEAITNVAPCVIELAYVMKKHVGSVCFAHIWISIPRQSVRFRQFTDPDPVFADPARAWVAMYQIQDGAIEHNKTRIITEFMKSSWIILTLVEIIYLKAKINYHCPRMISKAVCQNKNRNLADEFCHGHGFSRSLVHSRIQQALSSGWVATWIWIPKFPFVFALRNITRSWSAIPSETNTPPVFFVATHIHEYNYFVQ